jgi:hypothetical protein
LKEEDKNNQSALFEWSEKKDEALEIISGFFKWIEDEDEALSIIMKSSYGVLIIAFLNGLIGSLTLPAVVPDAIFLLISGVLLLWLKSRIVAVLLLLFGIASLVVTLLNIAGYTQIVGTNIIFTIIIFWLSIKAVEATFKLHGKFREEENDL